MAARLLGLRRRRSIVTSNDNNRNRRGPPRKWPNWPYSLLQRCEVIRTSSLWPWPAGFAEAVTRIRDRKRAVLLSGQQKLCMDYVVGCFASGAISLTNCSARAIPACVKR